LHDLLRSLREDLFGNLHIRPLEVVEVMGALLASPEKNIHDTFQNVQHKYLDHIQKALLDALGQLIATYALFSFRINVPRSRRSKLYPMATYLV
jgi:hypothetical protein